MHKSGEDYLEAILVISRETFSPRVRTTDVAHHLGVSKPSVSRAMSILRNDGYIEQENYGDIILTKKGLEVAEKVYNRHTTLTFFFRDILKVDKELAEHDACLIEHDISEESMTKLQEFVDSYKG